MIPVIRRLLHSILTWVIGAILLALIVGSVRFRGHAIIPKPVGNVFATFSDLFSQFLSFSIPLIIIGLVTPAIADLGRGAGKWLGITTALAYTSTLFAGFLTFLVCAATFPRLLSGTSLADVAKPEGALSSYFTVKMPPAVEVMTALLLSFVLGIGLSMVPRGVLRKGFIEFRAIITRLIERIIIPLLPLHIFGIFLNLTYTGAAGAVMKALLRVVVVVLILEVVILGIQFLTAGLIGRRNPLKALLTMLPAYLTALGTSSSAATIPVTLRQTKKNGVSDAVASFTVPLCATIHLAGSTSKIFAFAFAMTSLSLLLLAGSAPPCFTASASSCPMTVKIFPFAASFFSFFALIFENFECPDINLSLTVLLKTVQADAADLSPQFLFRAKSRRKSPGTPRKSSPSSPRAPRPEDRVSAPSFQGRRGLHRGKRRASPSHKDRSPPLRPSRAE